jgi:hypothetical protein
MTLPHLIAEYAIASIMVSFAIVIASVAVYAVKAYVFGR